MARYAAAHAAGSRATLVDPRLWVEADGIVGRLGTPERPDGRLLVVDDRALPVLHELGEPWAQVVTVMTAAAGACAHLRQLGRYHEASTTGMLADDLAAVPEPPLPAPLRLCDVGAGGDAAVSWADAAAACQRADDTAAAMTLDAFVAFLRSVPGGAFLAAVGDDGVVRATAGSSTVDGVAAVIFVSTDPALRGRGVATAMTAAALHAARRRGALTACLNASAAGRGIYRRLGFAEVAEVSMFMHIR